MDQPTPPRMRRSLDDRIAALAERQKELEAQRVALVAAQKSEARKRDTRRKIIIGSAVLAQAERDPAFAAQLRVILDTAALKPADRTIISDLLRAGEQA